MNDNDLRQLVIDELEYEPSVDAANIGVTAEKGVITLGGHVSNYAQRAAAERAAWRVKGVKGIAQKIEVRLPGGAQASDDQIAERALNKIAWSAVVPKDSVRVRVSDGWVTLSGSVKWNYQRNAAESEVRRLSGVLGITNSITLTPIAQTSDLKHRIRDALDRHADVEANDISVDVRNDGTMRIDGSVDNWDEKQAVEHAVWSAPGVRGIDDHLRLN